MSQENVEIVTRPIDAFNRREIDAFVEFGTPTSSGSPRRYGTVEGDSHFSMACTPSANPSGSITLSTYTPCRTAPQPDSQQNTPSSDPSALSSRPGEDRAHRCEYHRSAAHRPGSLIPDACHGPRVRDTPRAMSEESTTPDLVELTRHLYDAANSGDFDAMTSFFAPDAVWVTDEGIGTFDGVVAIRRFVEDWQGSYEQYEAEVNEVLDLGKGVTFAVSVQKGRVVGSSSDVQIRFAAVYTWAEGLIVRMTSYSEIDKARAAAERLAESRE